MRFLALLLFASNLHAGFYLDAGIRYYDQLAVDNVGTLSGQVVVEDEVVLSGQLTLHRTVLVPVENIFPLLRVGYEFSFPLHIEFETTGHPDLHFESASAYYRWRF